MALNGKVIAIGHIGVYSPVILILYLAAVYTVFSYESHQIKLLTEQEPDAFPDLSLSVVIIRYIAAALVVIVIGIQLPGGQANCPDYALARKFCLHLAGRFHHDHSGNDRCCESSLNPCPG
ncbi:MAG TPA: hypothetical protein VIJ25_15250 [Methylococcales bacterium]